MPASEIEMSKTYKDLHGYSIRIDAGPNGWTITNPDDSSKYKDIVASTQENFDEAFSLIKDKIVDNDNGVPDAEGRFYIDDDDDDIADGPSGEM